MLKIYERAWELFKFIEAAAFFNVLSRVCLNFASSRRTLAKVKARIFCA